MSRVRKRESELADIAAAYVKGDTDLDALRVAALRYAAAVFHNRRSRDKQKAKNAWESKAKSESD